MHKIFISYHHSNDQWYKEHLVEFGKRHSIFIDRSVDTGDIPDPWTDQQIRRAIRDRYLRDSTVTVVLVGTETRHRKHVDWEIYSSMSDGSVNKRSGIVVINLPGMSKHIIASNNEISKSQLYYDVTLSTTINTRAECKRQYPYMPSRIVDNLVKPNVKITVVPWCIINETILKNLIDGAFHNRANCRYDLSQPLRRANS